METNLWNSLVPSLIANPLWQESYAYDAGHALMVPMHAAYSSSAHESWAEDLERHATMLQNAIHAGTPLPENRIALQQYLYLFTQQAILQRDSGMAGRIKLDLVQNISDVQASIWSTEPAPQWDREPFPCMRERLLWKEGTSNTKFSFYRAIIDEEFFNFAIAADLCNLFGDDASKEAREAVEVADRLFRHWGKFDESGGWLFQPGTWWDHRDYAYAGYSEPVNDMPPRRIEGIAGDSSHAHRFARWLLSLRDADGSTTRRAFYRQALQGLTHQFTNEVLCPPSVEFPFGYRTTNYMDGHNGIFRWEYETQGEDNGYLPFQLSGTLLYGWWTFLYSEPIHTAFSEIAASFRLAEEAVHLYTGPNTSRDRHSLMRFPDFFVNGFAELIVNLTRHV